jgi:hypothetical protein
VAFRFTKRLPDASHLDLNLLGESAIPHHPTPSPSAKPAQMSSQTYVYDRYHHTA